MWSVCSLSVLCPVFVRPSVFRPSVHPPVLCPYVLCTFVRPSYVLCMSICPSAIRQFVRLYPVRPSVRPSVRLYPVRPSDLRPSCILCSMSVRLFVHPSVHTSCYPSAAPVRSSVRLSVCLFDNWSVCPGSVRPSVHSPVLCLCPFVCPSVRQRYHRQSVCLRPSFCLTSVNLSVRPISARPSVRLCCRAV